jgi:hypothetical protein
MPFSLEKKYHVDNDYSVCAARQFHGQGLNQHCHDKGDDYHAAAAFYLTNLFKNKTGLTPAALHHRMNDQSRMTAEGNSGCYFQDIGSQESNHPHQVNESMLGRLMTLLRKMHPRFLVKKYHVNVLKFMMDSI